ncbi:hypothetical protein JTF06_02890 [Desemzia sp. RIT804]|uniref:DUF5316 family protein n=1 Tax=Desemzia sp. RIT 804 TaxID=2810209 RepID=UPI00194E1901|nr:DUF5316 family protein [Desemzia sp. RIT 804]MBM6613840.1 hypothetical protein [Desemzia sp. RIT 804]
MKKSYLLIGSVGFILLSYLGSLLLNYSFYEVTKWIATALTIGAIILSGALASGDRMRSNYATNQERTKRNIFTGWNLLVVAIPFYLVMMYIELF